MLKANADDKSEKLKITILKYQHINLTNQPKNRLKADSHCALACTALMTNKLVVDTRWLPPPTNRQPKDERLCWKMIGWRAKRHRVQWKLALTVKETYNAANRYFMVYVLIDRVPCTHEGLMCVCFFTFQ